MPNRLPAPGLFSTKNCWPSVREKCSARTRPTMSVPPAGGEGTMMRTARAGYSCAPAPKAQSRRTRLAHRTLRAFLGNEHECDHARRPAAVDPVVDRIPLHQRVALLQLRYRAVQLHLDLAGEHDRVVDRFGAVVARRNAGLVLDQAKHGAVGGFPQVAALVPRSAGDAGQRFVGRDDGASPSIVTGDETPDAQTHAIRVCGKLRP